VTEDRKRQRFERLLKPELDALYRTARRVIGHAALAEEAVQDACLKAFTHFDPTNEPKHFRPWLFRVLMNQAIDTRRRKQRDLMRSDPSANLDDLPDTRVGRHPFNVRIPVKADTVYALKAATITVGRRTALR
jgi:RNA polymerase sigma factor (sigma-70 family)